MVLNSGHGGIRNPWGPGETDKERESGTWVGGRKEGMNRKREREGKEREGREEGGRGREERREGDGGKKRKSKTKVILVSLYYANRDTEVPQFQVKPQQF